VFWDWWLGGAVLGAFTVSFWLVEHRLLGVSGHFTAILDAVAHPEDERRANEVSNMDLDQLQAALEAATGGLPEPGDETSAPAPAPAKPRFDPFRRPLHVPATARVAFLLCIGLGAALTHVLTGGSFSGPSIASMGDTFTALFGSDLGALGVLLGGGMLVGFGTRMAGGCTSGHGLCGVPRFQPGSMLSTATFFGVGVLVAYLLEWGLR
jgi:hypothetical protein